MFTFVSLLIICYQLSQCISHRGLFYLWLCNPIIAEIISDEKALADGRQVSVDVVDLFERIQGELNINSIDQVFGITCL